MVEIMSNVCEKERVQMSQERLAEIAELSERNLRKALLMLEAASVQP